MATTYNIDAPCDVLAVLRQAELDLVMGKKAKRIRYRSDTGSEQESEFMRSDLAALKSVIARYENLCEISKGRAGTRRCIMVG
jgi:hypothetical protein